MLDKDDELINEYRCPILSPQYQYELDYNLNTQLHDDILDKEALFEDLDEKNPGQMQTDSNKDFFYDY